MKPLLKPHSTDNLYTTSEGSESLKTSEATLHEAALRGRRSLVGSTQDREPDALSSAHVPTICDKSLHLKSSLGRMGIR